MTLWRRSAVLLALPLAGLLGAGACVPPEIEPADGGDPLSPDGGPSYGPLDMDVVVRANQVVLHPRERERLCMCSRGDFPPEGFCAPEDDNVRCSCAPANGDDPNDGPARCFDHAELLDGDVIVGAAVWPPGAARMGVPTSDGALISSLGAPALRLVGCGGEVTLALPTAAPPSPAFDTFTSEAGQAALHWTSSDGASAAMLCAGNAFTGTCCRVPWTAAGSLPLPANEVDALWAMFSELAGGAEQQTTLGDVRVWHAGDFNVIPAFGPEPREGGRHGLGTTGETFVFLTTAGALTADDADLLVTDISADLSAANFAHTLAVRARGEAGGGTLTVDYTLAPDELAVRLQQETLQQTTTWSAVVPFVAPSVGPDGALVLGDDVPRLVHLDSGLLTLVNEANADDTLLATLTGTLDFPPLARPVD